MFTPHLAPANRGLLSTVTLQLNEEARATQSLDSLHHALYVETATDRRRYPFVTACFRSARCRAPLLWAGTEQCSDRHCLSSRCDRLTHCCVCDLRQSLQRCSRSSGTMRQHRLWFSIKRPAFVWRRFRSKNFSKRDMVLLMTFQTDNDSDKDLAFDVVEGGGVTKGALGFRAGGIHAGFRKNPGRLDMALVEADELCPAAATFTQNVFCAAPVTVSKVASWRTELWSC